VFYLFLEIAFNYYNRTETDTGGSVEHTKAIKIIMLKELGKLTLYLRYKE